MAAFFHAGRTNTDDCYDAGKHVHGSRRVYGHDDASRSRPAYAADCYNGGEVGALAAGASSKLVNTTNDVLLYCSLLYLVDNQPNEAVYLACMQ
jgi:hypothetical protein